MLVHFTTSIKEGDYVTIQAQTSFDMRFHALRARREDSRRQLRADELGIIELERELEKFSLSLTEAEASYRQMYRHVNAAYRAGKKSKAQRKLARKRTHGIAARNARRSLRETEIKLDGLRSQHLAMEAEYKRCAHQYAVVRHAMMELIAEETMASDIRTMQFMEYVEAAKVPAPYREDVSGIWHYAECDMAGRVAAVHLFWGGGRSPVGYGSSPDGVGHAHYVLAGPPGALRLVYARDAVEQKRRAKKPRRRIHAVA